jgi:hypothetical protein
MIGGVYELTPLPDASQVMINNPSSFEQLRTIPAACREEHLIAGNDGVVIIVVRNDEQHTTDTTTVSRVRSIAPSLIDVR